MRKIFLIILSVLFTIVVKSQNYTFTQSTYTSNGYPTNVLKGDFNNDGDMDVVMQNQTGFTTYLQVAGNTFSTVVNTYTTALQIYNCADFNGDGKLDILANANRLFLGNANGTFSLVTINQNIASYVSIASDFNGDGIKDLASVNSSTNSILSIYLGQGNGNFIVPSTYSLTGSAPAFQNALDVDRIAVNDLNNDNNQDLVISTVVNTGTVNIGYLSIYTGNGTGAFNIANTYTYNFDMKTVKICDMNIDGIKDIVFNSLNGIYVLQGDGIGGFTAYYNQTMLSSSIDIGDLNNDGKMDIVNFYGKLGSICSSTNTISIIDNTGASFSVNTNTLSVNAYYGPYTPIICDDFNGDGKIDLAVNTYSCTPTLNICYQIDCPPLTYSCTSPTLSCSSSTAQIAITTTATPLTYNWSGPGLVTSVGPTVTVNQSGTYGYTLTNSIGCKTVGSTTVYSNTAAPSVSTSVSNSLTCSTTTAQVFAVNSSSNSATYSWSGPGLVSGNGTKTITVNMPGTYSYTVTDIFNGCSNIGYPSVPQNTLAPTNNLSGGSLSCFTTSTSISANTTSLTLYSWSGPGIISTNTNNIVFVNTTGVYSCSITNQQNGCSKTSTFVVTTNTTQPTLTLTANTYSCNGANVNLVASSSPFGTYSWQGPGIVSGANSSTVSINAAGVYTCTVVANTNGCTKTATTMVSSSGSPLSITVNSSTICSGTSGILTAVGATSYTWMPFSSLSSATGNSVIASPSITTVYTVTGSGSGGCPGTATCQIMIVSNPTINVVSSTSVCEGSSISIIASGSTTYSWSTGALTASITITPTATDTYTVIGTDPNNCSDTQTINITVDNTCQDVWPGDANSDGLADNLDILELGLHYIQTGASRASVSNNWQSYFANNWTGIITNGQNLNHSDCNGDGNIDDNDTLAIYNNYGLTHAFKTAQTTTVNPQLSIVPDQAMVAKGLWGTASVYLGDATTNINNINGVAFTIDFDNTLIEPTNIYIEYQPSFMDVSQNLYFRKLDFANGKIFTANTHTVTSNVTGFGKIATLHYQVLSSLATDQVLNIGLIQANQSDASGLITSLTTGTGTLMAIGASVGLLERLDNNSISISPNPTNGLLAVNSKTELQKIEIISITGVLLLSEVSTNINHTLHLENFANGIYFVNVYQNNRIIKREKVVLNK